jgi:hypothetical protein
MLIEHLLPSGYVSLFVWILLFMRVLALGLWAQILLIAFTVACSGQSNACQYPYQLHIRYNSSKYQHDKLETTAASSQHVSTHRCTWPDFSMHLAKTDALSQTF